MIENAAIGGLIGGGLLSPDSVHVSLIVQGGICVNNYIHPVPLPDDIEALMAEALAGSLSREAPQKLYASHNKWVPTMKYCQPFPGAQKPDPLVQLETRFY
jgi:hypothetical protein